MSAEDDEATMLRMVTAPYRSQQNEEMTLVGLLYGAGLLVVLLPLLPFIVLLYLLGGLRRALGGSRP